jgi:hypothetical protein
MMWRFLIYRLLPFDARGRFRRNILEHAVDAFYLVEDAVTGYAEDGVGKFYPIGGHRVFGNHGA